MQRRPMVLQPWMSRPPEAAADCAFRAAINGAALSMLAARQAQGPCICVVRGLQAACVCLSAVTGALITRIRHRMMDVYGIKCDS